MSMVNSKWLAPVGVGAAVAALTIGLSLHPWGEGRAATPAASTATTSTSSMQVTADPPSGLVNALAHSNVVVSSAQASAAAPAISADKAADIARVNAGIASTVTASTATLANVTVTDMGPQVSTDPKSTPKIDPTINGRRLWIIGFPSVPVPILGKEGYSGPEYATENMAVFVDPQTGEFVLAQTY